MVSENVLITGAAGFIGRHLMRHLSSQGYRVHGLDRTNPGLLSAYASWHVCDLTTGAGLSAAIEATKPRFVVHLAALIKGYSLEDLLRVNVVGTRRLLDALRALSPDTVVLVAGSAAEYGFVRRDELPVTEQQALRPVTFYALSKVAQSLIAQRYWLCHNLHVLRTRTFNLTGPGEPPTMVCSAFARQIAALESQGESGTLEVGNLQSVRDLVDVRDAVRAYAWVMQNGKPGEVYNVCSGQPVKIQHMLELLLGMTTGPVVLKPKSEGRDPQDIPAVFGSCRKLRQASGWRPEISLEKSLADLLDFWRDELRSASIPARGN